MPHLALVGFVAGFDEELAAVGELDHRERGVIWPVRSDTSEPVCPDLPGPRAVTVEHRVGDAGAAGLGQEVGAEADQPRGWAR